MFIANASLIPFQPLAFPFSFVIFPSMTTVADIEARIGGFSYPSKMPCASWSTPNSKCGVGSKLRKQEGTIYNICYASNGTYNFRSTVDAMARRYSILSAALKNPAKWSHSLRILHGCSTTKQLG